MEQKYIAFDQRSAMKALERRSHFFVGSLLWGVWGPAILGTPRIRADRSARSGYFRRGIYDVFFPSHREGLRHRTRLGPLRI